MDTSGSGLVQLVEAGQLRVLAVMAPERSKRFPQAPTFQELGYGLVQIGSGGYGTVKGLDPELVARIHAGLKTAMFDPAHLATIERFDMQAVHMDSAEYTAFARRLYGQYGDVVRRLGLKLG